MRTRSLLLTSALLYGGAVFASRSEAQSSAKVSGSAVYALQYGLLRGFPVSGLIAGADTSRRLDVSLMVWLIRRPDGRNVLVDAGFYREKFMARWKPAEYRKPSDAIGALGLKPEDITDIIITHVHWDHVDGADLFPNARVWLQQAEYDHHIDSAGKVLDRTVDALDAQMLVQLRTAGRLQLVQGDDQEIIPGITVHTGGKHTFASQYVSVQTDSDIVVLASDNAYLYENLATQTPIAQTLDSASNRQAQARMIKMAGTKGVVVPGHDPAVMVRFEKSASGVVRIR